MTPERIGAADLVCRLTIREWSARTYRLAIAPLGLGYVPPYHPLTAWDETERRRRGGVEE